MDENEMVGALESAALQFFQEQGLDVSTRTFRDAGVLTTNAGLVVRVDGHEFQVTVVRSR